MTETTGYDRPANGLRRAAALAGACLLFAAPASAIVGGGLYDFIIQTNCMAVPEQQDTRTPFWATERIPVFSTASARGYVRTIDQPDIIEFTSSDPAVVPPPPRLQAVGAIGGVMYQQTPVTFQIKAPSSPRDVTIAAKGQPKLDIGTAVRLGQGASDTMKLRVYPPQAIRSVTLSPAPPQLGYKDGDRVTVTVKLAQKHPLRTSRIVMEKPTYQTTAGATRAAPIREWSSGAQPVGFDVAKDQDTVTFSFLTRFPDDARTTRGDSTLAPFRTTLTLPVKIESASTTCGDIVKTGSARTLSIPMQKPVPVPTLQKEGPELPAVRPGLRPVPR